VKWTISCEELVGLGVKRFGPLLRYGLLRVKWTISVKVCQWEEVCQCEEGWSTFEVEFIKGEVDHEV
jgi:hypothetical protein